MKLKPLWVELENEPYPRSEQGIVRRRIYPESSCPIFLGLERPSGKRLLILRVSGEPRGAALPPEQTRAIAFQQTKLPDDEPGAQSLVLSLVGGEYKDIFDIVVSDIAGHVAGVATLAAAIKEFGERLEKWELFFEQYGNDGLSEPAQKGLFGELWFIRNYLLDHGEPRTAISGWTGPQRKAQDFQFPHLGVETKTTTSKQHEKIQISNEKQLDSSLEFVVVIFHLSLDALKGTGLTLPDLVEDIRTVLSLDVHALALFNDCLVAAGYLDIHSEKYLGQGYVDRGHQFFEVRDSFPRIVGRDLLAGVGDVSYSITVAACLPYQMDEDRFKQLLSSSMRTTR